jgi:hypothetical protein
MHTSPTDGLLDEAAVLFLLSEIEDLPDDPILIDGGPRLDVFETRAAVSRAQDLAMLAVMA